MKFQQGNKTVTSAGTAEALASSDTLIKALTIKADEANTNKIYPGDSTVDNTYAGPLSAGDSLSLTWPEGDMGNLADIYIDADTNGEGVVFWYLGR